MCQTQGEALLSASTFHMGKLRLREVNILLQWCTGIQTQTRLIPQSVPLTGHWGDSLCSSVPQDLLGTLTEPRVPLSRPQDLHCQVTGG